MRSIRSILKQWKTEAKATRVIQFKYNYSTGVLSIYTSQPGYLIGRHGDLVEKYKQVLKESIPSFTKVEFWETDYFWV